MQKTTEYTVLIIGGGASGVILALHLLHALKSAPGRKMRIILVEQKSALGRGLAYSTSQPDHLLNVRARMMSAYAEQPDHFHEWLVEQGLSPPEAPFTFAPRMVYGQYLQSQIDSAARDCESLEIIHGTMIDLSPSERGIDARLADGSILRADTAVLALGHSIDIAAPPPFTSFQDFDPRSVPRSAPLLIRGSGLSMIDIALSLDDNNHEGKITILSRHGHLPLPHHYSTGHFALEPQEVPFGATVLTTMRWLRSLVNRHVSTGGDWRAVIDSLRPHTQNLWLSWPETERRRFLRHVKTFWDIHRHRVAPEIHERVKGMLVSGLLELRAGRITGFTNEDNGIAITLRPRGQLDTECLHVKAAIDATGVIHDIGKTRNPVLNSLIAAGHACKDRLGLSLDTSRHCELIGREGEIVPNLFAIGPLTRGTFFEIDAIPDIRVQCLNLAQRLLAAQS